MKCHLSAPLVLYLSHWQGQDGFRQLYTLVICLDTVQTLLMNGDTYLVRIMTSNFSLDRFTCLPSALHHQLHPNISHSASRVTSEPCPTAIIRLRLATLHSCLAHGTLDLPALCSANLAPTLSECFRNLSVQFITHVDCLSAASIERGKRV
jgi:hypothetical protein